MPRNKYLTPTMLVDRPSSELRAAIFAELYQSGHTLRQIGDNWGVSYERVRQILKKNFGISRFDSGRYARVQEKHRQRDNARAERHYCRYKCSREAREKLHEVGRAMQKAGYRRQKWPTHVFIQQRNNMRRQGICWELSLLDWWQIWLDSGHWLDQGRGRGKYRLCRVDTSGAYVLGNVEVRRNDKIV